MSRRPRRNNPCGLRRMLTTRGTVIANLQKVRRVSSRRVIHRSCICLSRLFGSRWRLRPRAASLRPMLVKGVLQSTQITVVVQKDHERTESRRNERNEN
jgi:hypothetical protein